MLVLPLASFVPGALPPWLLMVGLWALMAFTAMLQVEASLNTGKWYLHQLADHLLGPWGKRIASFCILMLFYALASAYISGGSSLLVQVLTGCRHARVSQEQAAWAFTLLFGGMVCVGTKQVDYLNRLMFTVKLVIVVGYWPCCCPRRGTRSPCRSVGACCWGLPVIFTSFGFMAHPSVMLYLGGAQAVAPSLHGAPPCPLIPTCCGGASWGCWASRVARSRPARRSTACSPASATW